MSYFEAIVLGLVQALTEFLPISSDGHLVLAQAWFGQHESDLLFIVLLHTATMAAVAVYFRRELVELVRGLFGHPGTTPPFAGYEAKTVWLILLANIPTGIIGLLMEKYAVDALSTPPFAGLMLIATGAMLWLGRDRDSHRGIAEMTNRDALLIGVAQGLAVLPGLSRSAMTIVVALLLGIDRSLAAKYSLLMSIPAIAGATLLKGVEALQEQSLASLPLGPYLAGMLVAAVFGFSAVHLLIALVRDRHFFRFAYYVWPVGLLAMLTALF